MSLKHTRAHVNFSTIKHKVKEFILKKNKKINLKVIIVL